MCIKFLYDEINNCNGSPCNPAVPIDGEWFLTTSPIGYPVVLIVDGGNQSIPNDETQVGTDYNPEVDFGFLPTGDYTFTYSFGEGCPQELDLVVHVVQPPCQMENLTLNICTGQGVLNLFELFSGECLPTEFGNFTPQGDISGSGITLSQNDDLTDDTIDTGVSEPGTYILVIEYFLEDTDCDNCTRTATITINVSETPMAGSENDIVICS